MSKIKGDFLGFTFDGIHSSELGIFRVSDGSRYTDNLLPTIQDKTIQVPGGDGTYYYGSYYTQKPFNLSIAYDNLDEDQLRRLRTTFSDKKIHELIYDETPYKVYMVKITGTPNLKYVAFDDPNEIYRYDDADVESGSKDYLYGAKARVSRRRFYKGEGQINFIAYNPFAKSRYKYLDSYTVDNIPEWGSLDSSYAEDVHYNLDEWIESSRLISSGETKRMEEFSYVVDVVYDNGLMYYNAGDIETPFNLSFIFEDEFPGCIIGTGSKSISIEGFSLFQRDDGIRINTRLHLIEGIEIIDGEWKATGTIYNKHIEAGDFFNFEPTIELTWLPIFWNETNIPANLQSKIEYNYLYY